jgi:hypothetical protein
LTRIGFTFTYQDDSDYSMQIMKFLNELISRPFQGKSGDKAKSNSSTKS